MEIGKIGEKCKYILSKYRYVALILLVGIVLMLIPNIGHDETITVQVESAKEETPIEESLSRILSKMSGAGRVEVMLNIGQGPMTVYQMDEDITKSDTGYTDRSQTVTVTDGQRKQSGLVKQVNPPVYLGAVVLCQGANDPVVKLSIVEAVSKITGLNANTICVLKMD